MPEKKKLLLVDGHSILSRAFYGIPELTSASGLHTNAIYGFLNILFKVMDEEGADHLAVAFDLPAPTFRHKMFGSYKGTRKPMPEELREQVPVMKELLGLMHVPILSLEGYEADDVLGTVGKMAAQEEGCEVCILSGDRDLLQLADAHIKISIPKTAKGQTEVRQYYPEDVKAEWEVTPEEFVDLKALMGDSSDNIPGVPGMGPKTAQWIIAHYHSIENAREHALDPDFKVPRKPKAGQELLENWESAKLSKELAQICTTVPIEFSLASARADGLYNAESLAMVQNLAFKSLYGRFAQGAEAGGAGLPPDPVSAIGISHLKETDDPYIAKIAFKDARNAGRAGFFLSAPAENAGTRKAGGIPAGAGNLDSGSPDPSNADASNAASANADPADPNAGQDSAADLYFALPDGRLYRFRGLALSGELAALSQECALYTLSLKEQLPSAMFSRDSRVYDVALAAYLADPLKDSYAYEDLARDYLGEALPPAKGLENPGDAYAYTALVALRSQEAVFSKIKEMGEWELYTGIEMPLVYTLHEMEEAGVLVDRQALVDFSAELREGIEKLRERIYHACGEEFNINSPQQLGKILFEKLGMPGGRKTKTGYSTAADVLEKLAEEYEVVDEILMFRTLSKLNSTYAEGLQQYIEADGRIHGRFNQMVTATGRISSTDPNLQNIPIRTELGRRFRKVFEAAPGCVFLDADYSQVELRILASLSGDEKLIDAYRHADDIHAVTASQVFHVPLSEVTPQLRRNAKAVNFGIVYGISAFGLSAGLSISRKEAKEYIERYFETYPAVKAYLDGQIAFAREHGYVTTLFGRRRPIPDLKSSNFARRSFGERVAMNSPVQGAAADIMKKAMNEVADALRESGFSARIVLQVHDELLVEAPEEEAGAVGRILKEKMEGAASLGVALVTDLNTGKNWDEAH